MEPHHDPIERLHGDARANEIAGHIRYFGPALFGAGVPCDRERAAGWMAIAAQSGRFFAQMLVHRIGTRDVLAARLHPDPIDKEFTCTPNH